MYNIKKEPNLAPSRTTIPLLSINCEDGWKIKKKTYQFPFYLSIPLP
jgi:hypothetical protein